ncbi:hypothetical protein DLAC_09899 [Tieghemostelium lacteum]|uniref:non-specific serine/threonine protein kinase n=1 Tax=Tieghemostelium lacteum TaxID=361077 RepID=A0A151Z5M6_TIELA|nr:hypothetical protein DLAC_09899 [Tieghemostelium lacteum]|eukprot:KYQ89245.1 hypothetical protein DLAC_09899 [Tieghemostelium lacteum]
MSDLVKMEGITDLTKIGAELISQGAEAKTFKLNYFGMECIIKERFVKTYRHPTLDSKISNKRILQEIRSLNKCKKNGIDVPGLLFVDIVQTRIMMEFVNGITVKQFLYNNCENNYQNTQTPEIIRICREIGQQVCKIHDLNLIHGDLTTSNILLRTSTNNSTVFIDFGLSYTSTLAEDKAVDLYVLERAFISTHPNSESLFNEILQSYKDSSKNSPSVINRLDQVRLRGRKKLAFG